MDMYTNLRKGEKGAWISIGAYVFLSAIKLFFGFSGSSEALKADGLNNLTDILASIAVLVGLRISQKPPDENHHYGHLRAETIASLLASFIMAAVGLQVLANAIRSIFEPVAETPSLFTAWIALFSAIVMYVVYRYNLKLSQEIKSSAVRAAAYDNRSDALVSIGAGIGIMGAVFGAPILDVLTAFIIGLIIIKTALDIFKESVMTLTDGFDEDEVETLSVLVRRVPGVISLRDFKGRNHGNVMFIDLTVSVAPKLNVIESHWITEEIERKIQKVKPHCVILVHIEPDFSSPISRQDD
ncbi:MULTISPECIES: cation diffusion facilitator family transporter [Planococcus]|uniref:Transporter n=1 Tax=Planococcus faecalis TaxID=1598147 RepID=A0ABM6IQZ8_9BACL|nr:MULTISPECIES: cation diffusion facilitator family transporter [Planococcus]AQU78714.1 transporter [Planococcus faecalis]KAA0956786.1 cation transporter [Planococcus sp. ANT_H30]MDJ0332407.1 cation diffusion facilitator family transporter [Planococcus sp. S3-L1]OHX53324.1 transporter [Planococcus faecalis]